jgi:Holliday junction resolvase RusA-like endonuclease
MSNSMIFVGTPIPKPRMTVADRWKKRPIILRYFDFKDEIVKQAEEQGFILGNIIYLKFYMPIPKSRKRLVEGEPHLQRPDVDNMEKGILDCLLKEDSKVWFAIASKVWSSTPRIEISNLSENMLLEVLKTLGSENK